jgi:SRSO17 transposase
MMLRRAFAGGVLAAWVVSDTVYGADPELRLWLEAARRVHFLAVAKSHRLWHGAATWDAAERHMPRNISRHCLLNLHGICT